ncbi:MAG: rhodanese-like domain-containing protein [Thiohalomonadaceae bacterium]
MKYETYSSLVAEVLPEVKELFPWDLAEKLKETPNLLLLDVREPSEFNPVHIEGSLNVPRGVLESACDWDYDETEAALASGREREIIVICRSGHRSVLAAHTMQRMGFQHVYSLKTGIRGWFEYEQPLIDVNNAAVDEDFAEDFFTTKLRPDQRKPG